MMTSPAKIKLLFLCTGNSCRSQMAEAWVRHLKASEIDVASAGLTPKGIDPRAVAVMRECNVDMAAQSSKAVGRVQNQHFDFVVTLCGDAHETCPVFPGRAQVIHVGFDDPPRLAADAPDEESALLHYRRVRDAIREFVVTLPQALIEGR